MSSDSDFTGNPEDWEKRVFENAKTFRLHRFYGRGNHDHAEEANFEKVLREAITNLRQGRRVIVYAVSDAERFVSLPQERWLEYLRLWRHKKGESK